MRISKPSTYTESRGEYLFIMQYIIEGILFGLTLTILLGPIFIVLIQSSLENGSKAGLIAASGIWVSDILIVGLALTFIQNISPFVQSRGFVFWVGLVGGIVLISVGLATFVKKTVINFERKDIGASGIIGYWIKGFMVNTINPFTFIFWLSTITAFVASRQLNNLETGLFLGSIIFTIIVTDSMKVLLAKLIRSRINENLLSRLNKIAGTALIIFGFVLLLKSVV